jgi:hypothetical protein
LILEKVPLFLLSAASCVVTFYAQKMGGTVGSTEIFPISLRATNALVSVGKYAWKAVWPSDLSVFYPHPAGDFPPGQLILALLFLVGVTALVLRWGRRTPYLPVGWLWFLGTLVPTLGLVQVGGQAMADRYTYIPLTGLFVAAVWGVSDTTDFYPKSRVAAVATGVSVLVALSIVARMQITYWKDTVSLFTHALDVTPVNYTIQRNLGMYQNNLGIDMMKNGMYREAVEKFRLALEVLRFDAKVRINLGAALAAVGDLAGAKDQYGEALKIDGNSPTAHYNMGMALVREGKPAEAIVHFREVSRISPGYEGVRAPLEAAEEMIRKRRRE